MSFNLLGSELPKRGNRITALMGRGLFRGLGWKLSGEFPNHPKMIVAVAPHTSNIDFLLAAGVFLGHGLHVSYLAKQSLFKFPLGFLMSGLGGIPVDQESSQGLVDQLATRFNNTSKLVLGITPEGTRGKVSEWKKGFALIAQAANVPILPAIADYKTKVVRLEKLITNVQDTDHVLRTMKSFADTATPRFPRKFLPLKPD